MLVSAVKLADDRSGDLIVRLYESTGGRASTEVVVDLDAASVRAADLLERGSGEPVAHSVTGDGRASVELAFRPFQVRPVITPPVCRACPVPSAGRSLVSSWCRITGRKDSWTVRISPSSGASFRPVGP
ncbi:MAG: glycosyl hydrolase-related protein [Micropruina sp.]